MNKVNYWFTGDWHLGHNNILDICKRPFKTIEEHDNAILNNHNSLVTDESVVFNFGDVGFRCSAVYVAEMLRKFNGKIIIILGNHDKSLREAIQRGMLDKELNSGKIAIMGGKASVVDPHISISKTIEIDNQSIFVSHYGHRTWPGAFRGAIHLYAHSHSNLPPYYRSFDVGVDTNNYRPYSFQDIMDKISKIPSTFSENENS